MIKVIDAGYLRDKRVEAYLKGNAAHKLAFTDFACMEALKGETVYNIKKSLEIVSKYTKQILILKCLPEILKVDFNSNNFRKAFIDNDQTLTFPRLCIKTLEDNSDTEFTKDLLRRSRNATKCLEEKIKGAGLVLKGIVAFNQELDQKFLKYIRSGKKWTINEYQCACFHVLALCKKLFEMNVDKTQLPEKENFLNHYIFRYTLSCFFLTLKWLIEHGWTSYSHEGMRNDLVDMSYVAFATYFDGVLSKDNKINSIYPRVIDFIEYLQNNMSNK